MDTCKELDKWKAQQIAKDHVANVLLWSVDETFKPDCPISFTRVCKTKLTVEQLEFIKRCYHEQVRALVRQMFPKG